MRIVVLGAGAVGSLLGARLAAAHHSVVLVGRLSHVEAIQREGLRVEGAEIGSVRLEASTEIPPAPPPDAVLLTVKSFDLVEALRELATSVAPTATLLTENGLGVAGTAAAALRESGWIHPERETVRGVHSIPALLVAPGVVRATGVGELLLPEPAGPAARTVGRFRTLLTGAGVAVRLVASIDREEWRKAIVNAAINPVTAVRGVANGALSSGALHAEAIALLQEARAVARSEGVEFEETEVEADFERVVRATAENRSSMLQDLERGRPTEIEAISGEILRRGTARRVPLPATRRIVLELRRRVRRARGAPQPS